MTVVGTWPEIIRLSRVLARLTWSHQPTGQLRWRVPVPVSILKLAATMLGKPDVAQGLFGSLQVDIEKTRRLLGWKPSLSLDEGLKKAAEGISV